MSYSSSVHIAFYRQLMTFLCVSLWHFYCNRSPWLSVVQANFTMRGPFPGKL